jgi:hypothetical protein
MATLVLGKDERPAFPSTYRSNKLHHAQMEKLRYPLSIFPRSAQAIVLQRKFSRLFFPCVSVRMTGCFDTIKVESKRKATILTAST